MKSLIILIFAVTAALATSAQTDNDKMPKSKSITVKGKYSCPMHPEVVMGKPGKCSKCGMDLTKSKKEQMKMDVMKIYTCPMHPDEVSNKPGTCSKCGMNLVEKESRNRKRQKVRQAKV